MSTEVAVALNLPAASLERLAAMVGAGARLVDLREASPDADAVVVGPVNPQLIGVLRAQFPKAEVLVVELDAGPVTRVLDAGASAYLVAGSLEALAAALGSATAPAALPAAAPSPLVAALSAVPATSSSSS